MIRLAAVSYLNTRPLTYGLKESQENPAFELSYDIPSRVAERLHQNEADLALIPVMEYRNEYAIVPGISIATRSEAGSVFLIGTRDPRAMHRIALDPASRTSVALARILFAERWDAKPEFIDRDPLEALREGSFDGAVVIGDPALGLEDSDYPVCLDLGKAWTQWTKLPFVFAFWAGRKDLPSEIALRLQQARAEGLDHLDAIAQEEAKTRSQSSARIHDYLARQLCFSLDEEDIKGLREFYKLAHKHGLLESIPELEFFETPS